MNTKLNKILAEISAGELVDKITILEIKKEKISDESKLIEVNKELSSLKKTYSDAITPSTSLENIYLELLEINKKLWKIEDEKRIAEKEKKFDKNFIELSRNVYKFNDQRSKLKLKINKLLGSNLSEVKSHY